MTTDIGELFSMSLPWKQREAALKHDFPQFSNLIVAVIDADIPEEADATAAGLADALRPDHAHFLTVRQPTNSPYLNQEGLLFLAPAPLQDLLDHTVDAEPFLGQLTADPSARGLFRALGLVAVGAAHGQAPPASFDPALRAFDSIAGGRAGWTRGTVELAEPARRTRGRSGRPGPHRPAAAAPRFTSVQPGGAATAAMRAAAAKLDYVRSGHAHVHVTGDVPLADEEFGSAAKGALSGLMVSFVLVVLWLFLALRSWRLILPVVATLLMGLALTTGFAAAAVGTLNLISVAFAILFVGIAVDFAIQFTVRFREIRHLQASGADQRAGADRTARRRPGGHCQCGHRVRLSGLRADQFPRRGRARRNRRRRHADRLCLHADLPAGDAVPAAPARRERRDRLRPRRRAGPVAGARPLGGGRRVRLIFVAGIAAGTRLHFDSNTLHTKSASSEAVQTLMHLLRNQVTNPFTISIMRPDVAQAAALGPRLAALPLVDHTSTC